MADKKLKCKDILGNEQTLEIDKDRNLIATTITSTKPVMAKIGARDVPVGFADPIIQIQRIAKENVEILYTSLVEQLETQVDVLKPQRDYLEVHEHYDAEGKMFKVLDDMKREGFKKYPKLDKYADIIMSIQSAKDTMKTLEPGLKSITQQVKFLSENYGF